MIKECIVVINAKTYFSEENCIELLNNPLDKNGLRELTQCYFIITCLKMKSGQELDQSFQSLMQYEEQIKSKIYNKLSIKLYNYYVRSVASYLPWQKNIYDNVHDKNIKQLNIHKIKEKEIIKIKNEIFFEEIKCNEYLIEELTAKSQLELFKTYFFITCLKTTGVNAISKNGESLPLTSNFENMLGYEGNIKKVLRNITTEKVMINISEINKSISFSNVDTFKILDIVIPKLLNELNLSSDFLNNKALNQFNNVFSFNSKNLENYLKNNLTSEMKKELIILYFIYEYSQLYPDHFNAKTIILHPNINEIKRYQEQIELAFKKISEDEIWEQIAHLNFIAKFNDKEKEIVFDKMSIAFDAEEKWNKNAQLINFKITKNNNMPICSQISFNERAYKKSLQKTLSDTSMRELIVTYFLALYIKNISKPIKNLEKQYINLDENMNNLDTCINPIVDKLYKMTDNIIVDKDINTLLRFLSLTKQEENSILVKVIHPLKKSLGLKPPSLFKHLL